MSYVHECRDFTGAPLRIVHRNLKPTNVLISIYGEVKIANFGVAKAVSHLHKTEDGLIKGSFSYLSPESAWGESEKVDARTDIFAVGIILWEMLAGRRLFLGDSDYATVKQVQKAEVPSIRQLGRTVPDDLERILARALARDLDQRYATARSLGEDLAAFLHKSVHVSAYDIGDLVRGAVPMREGECSP